MGDVLSMSACVITRRTICGFAALTPPPGFLISIPTRDMRSRAYLRVYVFSRVYVSVCVCRRTGGIGRRRWVNLIVGFWVSASRRHRDRYDDGVRGREGRRDDEETHGVENDGSWRKLQARGYPIRRRASRRQLPATPTRYATVIP